MVSSYRNGSGDACAQLKLGHDIIARCAARVIQ